MPVSRADRRLKAETPPNPEKFPVNRRTAPRTRAIDSAGMKAPNKLTPTQIAALVALHREGSATLRHARWSTRKGFFIHIETLEALFDRQLVRVILTGGGPGRALRQYTAVLTQIGEIVALTFDEQSAETKRALAELSPEERRAEVLGDL
jgi:DNA-binding MarR family transcriptional regulator